MTKVNRLLLEEVPVYGPSSSLNNTLPVFDGTTGKLIKDSGILIADVGTGDVVGPASSVNDRIAVFNGTTGKLLKDGGVKISDLGGVPIGTPMPIISNLLPEGYLWLEGGTYDPLVYPEFAAYMNANSGFPAGILPDFRNRVLRGVGSFTGLVGTLQEDAFQGHYHQAGYATPGFGSPGAGSAFLAFSGPGPSTTAAATVTSDGTNGTPRIASETRVKSTIVRWAIKAYGSFINAGTADLVAIEQVISNGVIRKDLNQAAGSYSSAMKITVLSNTLQSWESIHRATFSNVAEYRRDELEGYRSIRVSGWVIPNATGTNMYLQTWKVGGSSWQTSGVQKSVLAIVNGATSSGFAAVDPGYLIGAPISDAAYGGIFFQIQFMNFSSSTVRTRAIGSSEYFNASSLHTATSSFWQDPTLGADMRIHLVAATGNISGEIVLEGLR